ncbi:MAG: tRNA 2-thiouridine(34) synthase MnmA [Candidatus Brocadiales bacterium]|nr:tRNA 2-thiouridine(34) synthase MnmA [Candidatus Bathyanammoxibius sp.]
MRRKIVVAMSGGVDSSVAAYLLKEQGHEVTGLFMRMGNLSEPGTINESRRRSCCSLEDAYDAERVAESLDIPFYVLNFKEAFEELVDYFCAEYARGRTPNPCIVCNQNLKFGRLLKFAQEIGASHLATGHYARLEMVAGRYVLKTGLDTRKDQSYVLFSLSQRQLAHALFPLGGMTKDEVRKKAAQLGLKTQAKPDSQEICFVPEGGYGEVIRERYPGKTSGSGLIKDTRGRVLGSHHGIQFFTIGQRRGLGIATGEPCYVVDIDPTERTVTVGRSEETLASEFLAKGLNWVAIERPGGKTPLRAGVKIRYNHRPAPADIYPLTNENEEMVRVVFDEPQKAVTPGQATVFYDGDVVLGGGWIERSASLTNVTLESGSRS